MAVRFLMMIKLVLLVYMSTMSGTSSATTFPDRCDFESSPESTGFQESMSVPFIGTLLPNSVERLEILFVEAYNTEGCGYRSADFIELSVDPEDSGMLHFNVSGRVCSFCSARRHLKGSPSPTVSKDKELFQGNLPSWSKSSDKSAKKYQRVLKGKKETPSPSMSPSSSPTSSPSLSPTESPSSLPSWSPSWSPSSSPSLFPSLSPTLSPSLSPTQSPSFSPSLLPSPSPSSEPSSTPSFLPSLFASSSPSLSPTAIPTSIPSSSPSFSDLDICSICSFSAGAAIEQFALAAQGQVEAGNLAGIQYVGAFSQPVQCPAQVSTFSADAIVSLLVAETVDDGMVTGSDIGKLEDLFGSTYNGLTFRLCDNQFRSVSSASFQVQSFRRLQSGTPQRRLAHVTVDYKADINGTCRGCDESTTLFTTNSLGMRQLNPARPAYPTSGGIQRRAQPGACTCSIDTMFEERAPTGEEFTAAYNETVTALNIAGEIPTVEGIESVTEVQVIPCAAQLSTFTGTVFVAFDGNPAAIETSEVVALEGQFVSSYNDLTQGFCDPLFRTVVSTTFSARGFRRLLSARNLQRVTAQYEGSVNGTCRRCSSDTTVFSLPDRSRERRRAKVSSGTGATSAYAAATYRNNNRESPVSGPTPVLDRSRFLQDTGCFCTAEGLERPRAPTADEFVTTYTDDVETLIDGGILTNVNGVSGLSEALSVPCSPEINGFSSTLLLSVEGDVENIETEEIGLLETAFGSSYNGLGGSFCDSLFRSISSATFTMEANRRLLSGDNRKLATVAAVYKVDVNATCRGCASNTTLLSEGTTTGDDRFLVAVQSRSRRSLQDSACVCSLEALESPRAPNGDELLAAYRQEVADLISEGSLPHVEAINSILELPKDTSSPSAGPSVAPSTSPSVAVSQTPTLSPVTSQPSVSSIFECDFSLLFSVTTTVEVSFNLTGDAQSLTDSDITSAFTESFNWLRTSRCEPFVTETSIGDGRRLQSSMVADYVLEISWLCDSRMVCESTQLFSEIELGEAILFMVQRDDFNGVTPVVFVVVPPPPTALPSASPSLSPVLTTFPPTVSSSPTVMQSLSSSESGDQCSVNEEYIVVSFESFEDGEVGDWQDAKTNPTYGSNLSTILGPFRLGNAFPSKTIAIPESLDRVFISFVFYEIDGWDGDGNHGTDTFGMDIAGDESDSVDFGWFKYTFSESELSGTSASGNIQWSITSKSISDSPQGFSSEFSDQEHSILVDIPPRYFQVSRSITIVLTWNLNDRDEMVGIDDFSVSGCAPADA